MVIFYLASFILLRRVAGRARIERVELEIEDVDVLLQHAHKLLFDGREVL